MVDSIGARTTFKKSGASLIVTIHYGDEYAAAVAYEDLVTRLRTDGNVAITITDYKPGSEFERD